MVMYVLFSGYRNLECDVRIDIGVRWAGGVCIYVVEVAYSIGHICGYTVLNSNHGKVK